MSTNAKCGMTGSTSLGGEVLQWTVNLEEDIPEVTNMAGAGFREYIPCLKSASGNFDTNIPCGAIGSHASVDFINDTETISMDIIVTDIAVDDPVDGAVKFSYSFVSTGQVSIA